MSENKPEQVKESKDAKEAGKPATVEQFQDDKGGTNLPDNPAYVAPESVDNEM